MKIVTICITFFAVALATQDPPKLRELKDRKWLEGKIVCIGCHLQNRQGGTDSQCTLHSKHAQGFLLKDETLWTFIDNERGHHLIVENSLRDKEVRVYGWTWPKAQYIEAYKYQIRDEEAWVMWDFCKI